MGIFRRLRATLATAVLLAGPLAAFGPQAPVRAGTVTVHVVAPDGDDRGPGTAEQPWRTIAHAATVALPGATVDVREGVYNEVVDVEVSGDPARPITFQAHPGERVTISGAGLDPDGGRGLIDVRGRSHLVFDGFELTGFEAARRSDTPAGVHVTGASSDITLRGLDVHGIVAGGYASERVGNAHGIAVYGTSGRSPITDLTITGNHVHDLDLGTSEAIVVNGNVAGFEVTDNRVDDVDNIAIDAIGFEGTAPTDDQARDGLIAGNTISDVDTTSNPGYDCPCAAAVYVDGARDIVIERNRISDADLGIEIGAEIPGGGSSGILVRNNLVVDSRQSGLTLGGYENARGSVRSVKVVNNTFLEPDPLRRGYGVLYLNFNLSGIQLTNNVFAIGSSGKLVTGWARDTRRTVFRHNRWFAEGRPESAALWILRGRTLRGYDRWQDASGESGGSYGSAGTREDGVPLEDSALIDAGLDTPVAGTVDIAGAERRRGAAIDIGAFEVR